MHRGPAIEVESDHRDYSLVERKGTITILRPDGSTLFRLADHRHDLAVEILTNLKQKPDTLANPHAQTGHV
jgi:hypothetical protein